MPVRNTKEGKTNKRLSKNKKQTKAGGGTTLVEEGKEIGMERRNK